MAEPNGPLNPNEPPMEKRMIVAFLVMALILFATPYFYRTFMPQPATRPAATKPTGIPTPAAQSKPAPPEAKPEPPVPSAPAAAENEELRRIDTHLYTIVFSNRGAVVRSWVLKKYHDNSGKPLDLANAAGAAKTGYPFSLAYKDKQPSADLNSVLWAVEAAPDGLGLVFRYSDGRTAAEKSFRFDKNSYLSECTSRVAENGTGIQHLIAWRGGFGDAAIQNAAGIQKAVYYDVQAASLLTKDAKAGRNGPVDFWGQYSFAGVEDNYFAAVWMPRAPAQTQVRVYSDSVASAPGAAEAAHVGAAVGGEPVNRFTLFVGPKDVDLLERIDKRLAQLVNFGKWFGWLARPLFTAVDYINDHYIHNYGWAIVVVTILINSLMLPLRFSSMKSMKKMQALQPQIQAINAKYKGVGIRDPRSQEKNAEVMELYKKHGINPAGGCLPMLPQIPIFIAFYNVLTIAIEMRGANFLWVRDLSQHDPFYILPIVMVIAQFAQQKMTPNPSADPSQQRMMLIMPLVFGFMFMNAASGLVLYWLTSNLFGILTQYFINKAMSGHALPPQPALAPAAPGPKPRPQGAEKRKSGSKR